VPNFYQLQDRLVGDLIDAAGPDAIVMVVSDHGFANGGERPVDSPPDIEGKPGRWHTLDGVLIAAGPSIRSGELGSPAGLLDIAPTVLALLGLPQAADMPGHVLSELFEAGAEPARPAVEVRSYDEIGEPLQTLEMAATSGADPEMMEKLRALGYLQSGSDPTAGSGTPTYHVNAGRIFLEKNDLDRAEADFARAREMAPDFDQAILGLAEVKIKRGRSEEAIPLIEEVLSKNPDPQPALLMRAAQVYGRAGQRRHGLEFLGKLRFTGRQEAYRLAALGALHQAEENAPAAIDLYRKALQIDLGAEPALKGLYTLMSREGNLDELAAILEKSQGSESLRLALQVTNWLALVRERQRRLPEAQALLTRALEKGPDDVMTLTNLGSMLVDQGRVAEGIPYLEKAYGARPKSFEIVVNLIVGYGKVGKLDSARRLFQEGRAIARPAEMKHLYNAIAFACFFNGARSEANDYLVRSLAIDPNQQEAKRLRKEFERAGS
ncbi:MAG TPA: tetratricopeptide repeat protein, partial [Candidatus Polarisedimenticolia bacterium]|nr:tetratricopeptide repeat protein [Candidatus Polarisedimenticolia bacterium]